MRRHLAFICIPIWIVFILISGKWAANPLIWGFQNKTQTFSVDQAREKFPMHLVEIQAGAMAAYTHGLLDDEEDTSAFNLWEWASKESRSRFLLSVPIWMAGGFFLIWFLHREARAQKSL